MKVIYKYPVEVEDSVTVTMPEGAQVLAVQVQRGVPCIWALVDPKMPAVDRKFRWVGTGHAHQEAFWVDLDYIGSIQLEGGRLVFHLFEVTK